MLLWFGFAENEINVYEGEDDMPSMEDEWETVDIESKRFTEIDDKSLVFLYFVGHAVSKNQLVSAIGAMGESNDHDFENFLRDCASQSNTYCIGLFDCCRSDRGRGGLFTDLSETHNIASIYRENLSQNKKGTCACEPGNEDCFMINKFFNYLREQQPDAAEGEVELRVLTDF